MNLKQNKNIYFLYVIIMISRSRAIEILKHENCPENVILHSIEVSKQSLYIARLIQKVKKVDLNLVEIGSLLHDIGRCKSHNIDHAIIGIKIAQKYKLNLKIRNIIKKHIGSGITKKEAIYYGLPEDNYIPDSIEEKIVAYADNLLDGTNIINIKDRIIMLKKKNFFQMIY